MHNVPARAVLPLRGVLKDYLWGGKRLKEEYGKASPLDKIAESWELAAHQDGSSYITAGAFAGMTLEELWQRHKPLFGRNCRAFRQLPVLVKLIDSAQNLSIQVHPDNAYAKAHETDHGKTEMWYILDAKPGAYIYYGVQKPITREQLRESIKNETLPALLQKIEVKPRQLYFIPAGTIHSIGAGILLAEVQQNSNCTYRVFDYNRKDKDGKTRPLHVEKALDVASLTPPPPARAHAPLPINGGTEHFLASTPYFASHVIDVRQTVTGFCGADSFRHLLMLDGTGTLAADEDNRTIQKGESVFLPAGFGAFSITGPCAYLETWIPL